MDALSEEARHARSCVPPAGLPLPPGRPRVLPPDAPCSADGDCPGTALPFPQGVPLYLRDTVAHTFGNKWEGSFDWTGWLADTYLVFGHALEAAALVVAVSPGVVRSLPYAGPVTAESVHFDYSTSSAGKDAFAGQPDWTATDVAVSTSDLPH